MLGNRHTRFFTALFALLSLLFMQLAVANYVCPGAAPKAAEVAAMAEAGMPCAESMPMAMDESQPNLCQAHCQAGQQTADRYELALPIALDALPAGFTLPDMVAVLPGAPLQAPDLTRTTAPPVAIRHCCLRL